MILKAHLHLGTVLHDNPVDTLLVGDPLSKDYPLGDYLLKVIGTTPLGGPDENEDPITVKNTTTPDLQATLFAGGKKS